MRDEVATAGVGRGGGGRFPCFDGLRAVAAMCVLTFHFVGLSRPTWFRGNVEALVARLGGQGVGIFFVISGFLLYRPFVAAAVRGVPGPTLWPFWFRRFVRIFPAYWIALTAFVYFFGFASIHGVANFLTFYGLLQNYRGGYALLGLGIAWTLVIEVSFYLALPLINQIARSVSGVHASVERVFRVQFGMIATLAAIGWTVRALNIWVVKTGPLGAWLPLRASGYSLFAYLDWFAIGMVFAVFSVSSATGRVLPPVVAALARHAGACWVIAVGVFALQARLVGPTVSMTGVNSSIQFLLQGLIGLTAGFVVFPAVFGDQDQSGVRRFLRTKPMISLGGISYGIYLWHYVFVLQSVDWVANGTLPDVLFVRFLAVFALTIALASASFYVVEKPLIRWSQRISRARPMPDRTTV